MGCRRWIGSYSIIRFDPYKKLVAIKTFSCQLSDLLKREKLAFAETRVCKEGYVVEEAVVIARRDDGIVYELNEVHRNHRDV